jgi:hypothetical protein
MSRLRTLVLVAVALAMAAGAFAATAPKRITAEGVDGVRLGMTHKKLRAEGLVGRMRGGCPLGGTKTRSARLRRPLRGIVNYTTRKRPRRVRDITIRRGATARGVGIGDRIRDIRDAFPKARVNRDTEDTFGLTLVKIPRNGGGPMRFGVSTDTKRVTLIGVPYIAFCE